VEAPMVIKINNLSEGIHNLEFEEKIEELELKEPFSSNYLAKIKLTKLHNRIILGINLNTIAYLDCDRCGTAFKANLNNYFEMVYLFGDSPDNNESDNLIYLPVDTDKINLNKELRDYAILSIPMKKLCKEDCQGLCHKCGKNLNFGSCNCEKEGVDMRWQPLLELKNKMKLN
jgi:uncharacterized protein